MVQGHAPTWPLHGLRGIIVLSDVIPPPPHDPRRLLVVDHGPLTNLDHVRGPGQPSGVGHGPMCPTQHLWWAYDSEEYHPPPPPPQLSDLGRPMRCRWYNKNLCSFLTCCPGWTSSLPFLILNPINRPSPNPAVPSSRGTPLSYYLFSSLSHWPLQTLLNSLHLFITFLSLSEFPKPVIVETFNHASQDLRKGRQEGR